MTVRLRGGASVPTEWGALHITHPFVTLDADERGVCLTVHRSGRRASAGRAKARARRLTWIKSWSEIETVIVSRRAVAVIPRTGSHVRFVVLRRKRLRTLIPILESSGVRIQRAWTTVPKAFTIGLRG